MVTTMAKQKICIINSVYKIGSTGRICFELAYFLQKNNFDTLVCYGRNKIKDETNNTFCFYNRFEIFLHGIISRLFDKHGFGSSLVTKKLIKKIKEYKPDLIILNNLHGYYLNIDLFLKWIGKSKIKTIAVFHDCWNFTGHCAYFSFKKCIKWKTGCFNCPAKKDYPISIYFDNSKKNYLIKNSLFSSIDNLTIVTPSKWLADLVKQSFFSNCEVAIINNGIDTNIFIHNPGDFRERYHLEDKKIILCIANIFDRRKGIFDVIKLSELLCKDQIIVLVGHIKERVKLPNNIIHLNRTDNLEQLVNIHSSADVMFNPTYEDNYPTTNLEALSCKCPVICYRTGGAVEMVDPNFVIDQGDIAGAIKLINSLFSESITYYFEDNNLYSKSLMHQKYLDLIKHELKI